MPRGHALNDAEIDERVKAYEQEGTVRGAAKLLGIAPANVQAALKAAEKRDRPVSNERKLEETIAKLETRVRLADAEIGSIKRDNLSAAIIRDEIYGLQAFTPDPPAWLLKLPKGETTGVPMTMWSDWHYGETVFPEQVGGANEFNRKIAKARVRRLVEATVNLAVKHMVNPNYPGIVVCLGGDMISGAIHDELRETNDGPVQKSLLEVQELLIWGLREMADRFGKVFVPCVVGNHGRTTLKPRAKNRVYESYEWNLYCQLERHFANDPRIQFLIPGETDAYFTVLGHRFLLTHGDSLGVKGGDGIIGAIGPIARGATKVGRSEAQIGRDFDTLLMGHYHTYIPRGDAIPVLVNGALKGFDEYARLMLRVPYSRPSQALWFIHPKYGFTAQWQIYLEDKKQSAHSADWVSWEKRR